MVYCRDMMRQIRRLVPTTAGLSARLLVLTIVFVMLAEVFVFVPSVARFRHTYLQERLARAELAIQALEVTPAQAVTAQQERKLLAQTEARSVALHKPGAGKLILMRSPAEHIDATFDLREADPPGLIRDAFVAMLHSGNRVLRVVGAASSTPGGTIEIVLDEAPLRAALLGYGERIVALSLVISLFTATLVYISLHWLMVRPMRRLTASMTRFREDPEDAGSRIEPSRRRDEIGVAQNELAAMQEKLAAALHQKTRLAALGVGVTKISHDLKNILSTAQLISDRLTVSDDPEVRRVAPRLEQAIDRAVNLCAQTLNFAREGPPELDIAEVDLAAVLDDVGATLTPTTTGATPLRNRLAGAPPVEADREQLYRVFANLAGNAIEAGASAVEVWAEATGETLHLWVKDDGPGLPPRARDNLFQPFSGTVKKGGSGLGLAIARDLIRAHGGDLVLESSTAGGTCFEITLPCRQAGAGRPARPNRHGRGRRKRARASAAA